MESAANEFDLGALLPSVGSVVALAEVLIILVVLAGPLLTLGLGLLYWFKPPAEANYGLGFRCWWGMASLDSWQFTQQLAGKIFTILGGVMTLAAIVVSVLMAGMELMAMTDWAAVSVLCELVLIGLACLAINIVLICKFDKDGYRRVYTED